MDSRQISQNGQQASPSSAIFFLVLIIAGILFCSLSFLADQAVVDWVKTHQVSWLVQSARFLSSYGDWPQLMVSGAIILGIALFMRDRRLTKVVICMMISSSIAGALVNSIRLTSGRARPNHFQATQEWNGLWYNRQLLLFNNKYHSFPSGHAGAASAFFGVPLFTRRIPGSWTFLIAIAIGCSRIYLNVHHLSDVLFGILIGTLTAYVVWIRIGPMIERFAGMRS
jgi:membrane-associated phospholipid phosphatase